MSKYNCFCCILIRDGPIACWTKRLVNIESTATQNPTGNLSLLSSTVFLDYIKPIVFLLIEKNCLENTY